MKLYNYSERSINMVVINNKIKSKSRLNHKRLFS